MKDEKNNAASRSTEIGVNQIRISRSASSSAIFSANMISIQNPASMPSASKSASAAPHMEIEGDPLQVELASQIIRQLYSLLEKGYPVYASDVDYAIRILSGDNRAKLARYFPRHDLHFGAQAHDHAEKHRSESLYRCHPPLRYRLRHRPGRHRQDLSRHGHGRGRIDEE